MPRVPIAAPMAVSVGPYSHAIDAGDYVFLSGQTPIDSRGEVVAGGVRAQTHQCFENLFAVLEAGGLAPDDVVKVNVFLTDMSAFAEMNEVYRTKFEEPFPARTTIGVLSLPLGAAVEIELIAKRS